MHGGTDTHRQTLVNMKQSKHPMWRAFLQAAEEYGMSYAEAVDEWMSPEM